MKQVVIIAHDMRSCHNVGSLLRTAEGLGVNEVILSGYTPYPSLEHDTRLPHIHTKLTKQINKTALGAETSQKWSYRPDIAATLAGLKAEGFIIAALEQTPSSVPLPEYQAPEKIAVLLGREVEGIEPELLKHCDVHLEIPMFGKKESFNVVQASAMALYALRFI